jgi:hypothetical protein
MSSFLGILETRYNDSSFKTKLLTFLEFILLFHHETWFCFFKFLITFCYSQCDLVDFVSPHIHILTFIYIYFRPVCRKIFVLLFMVFIFSHNKLASLAYLTGVWLLRTHQFDELSFLMCKHCSYSGHIPSDQLYKRLKLHVIVNNFCFLTHTEDIFCACVWLSFPFRSSVCSSWKSCSVPVFDILIVFILERINWKWPH